MGFNTNIDEIKKRRIESYVQQYRRFQEIIQNEMRTEEGEFISPDKLFKIGNLLNEMVVLEARFKELGYTYNNVTKKFNDQNLS